MLAFVLALLGLWLVLVVLLVRALRHERRAARAGTLEQGDA